jgi:methionyl-tRNA formyltransferase
VAQPEEGRPHRPPRRPERAQDAPLVPRRRGRRPGDLLDLAPAFGIGVERVPGLGSERAIEVLRRIGPDLGILLGCGYVPPRTFACPRHGMINVHGELLPEFQGAASVVWSIFEGREETGFTIHQVDRGIDTGDILYQERFPIRLRGTLAETVRETVAEIRRRVPDALARAVSDYESLKAAARPQRGGRRYTTPTLGQFLRMKRQHRRLLHAAAARRPRS